MKNIFKSICIPLMLINYNVYTFISGILLSLSTGIFTTLCFDKISFYEGWNLYASSMMYLVSGAVCIYVATKTTSYHNYISSKNVIKLEEKQSILNDFELSKYKVWVWIFIVLLATLLYGTVFLFINFYK